MVNKEQNKNTGSKRRDITSLFFLLVIVVLLNFIGFYYFKRFDLTSEKRYTLAESTKTLLSGLKDEVLLKVYLNGDVNPGFNRLKNETREILDEFRAYSNNQVEYEFINLGEGLTKEETNNIEIIGWHTKTLQTYSAVCKTIGWSCNLYRIFAWYKTA